MKSLLLGLWMAVAAVLTVPLLVPAPVAQADSLVKVDSCVKIALPLFGKDNCVNNDKASGGAVVNYLRTALTLMSYLVGAVIVLMIVWAGYGYMMSAGDPGQIKEAKGRVVNAITALVLFLMMYAIINFLVPGQVLR
jgi:hypothetical protein